MASMRELGLAARRNALLERITRSETAAAAAADSAEEHHRRRGSKYRRIAWLLAENERLRQDVAELKQFLIDVGSIPF